jgi:hypothetical protein
MIIIEILAYAVMVVSIYCCLEVVFFSNRERYYLVFYVCSHPKGHMTGQVDMSSNAPFISNKMTLDMLKEAEPDGFDFVITNIIKLSKKEYKIWEEQ